MGSIRIRSVVAGLAALCAVHGVIAGCAADEPRFRPRPGQERAPAAHGDQPAAAPPARPAPPPPTPVEPLPPFAGNPAVLNPALATERAPEVFVARFDTTKGSFDVEVHRAWAPNGADRFYNLVRIGYFTDVAFFRVIDGFMAQTGIHGRPDVASVWMNANIPDDPVVEHNTRGAVTFAMSSLPNTRSNQFFVNFGDNSNLDPRGFAPFGRVSSAGMAVVDALYDGYGEGAPSGRGPAQARVQREGNAYLRQAFPELDYIRSASIVPGPAR